MAELGTTMGCWLTGMLVCGDTCVRGASSSRAGSGKGWDAGTMGGGDVEDDDADALLKWIPWLAFQVLFSGSILTWT